MTTTLPATETTTSTTTTPPNVLAMAVSDRLRGQELLLAATRLGKRGSVELTDAAIVGVNRKASRNDPDSGAQTRPGGHARRLVGRSARHLRHLG